MAGCDAQETIPVQHLRAYLSHTRAQRGRTDPVILFSAALRTKLKVIGPPPPPGRSIGTGLGLTSATRSYHLQVGRRWYAWNRVQRLLRHALEADQPPEKRSQAARDLAAFLHADRPTRVQYALARPLLVELWQNLNRN